MSVGKIDKVTFSGTKKLNFLLHYCECSKDRKLALHFLFLPI